MIELKGVTFQQQKHIIFNRLSFVSKTAIYFGDRR